MGCYAQCEKRRGWKRLSGIVDGFGGIVMNGLGGAGRCPKPFVSGGAAQKQTSVYYGVGINARIEFFTDIVTVSEIRFIVAVCTIGLIQISVQPGPVIVLRRVSLRAVDGVGPQLRHPPGLCRRRPQRYKSQGDEEKTAVEQLGKRRRVKSEV